MTTDLPPIAISLGDPAGIGPEITLKAVAAFGQPCVVVGSEQVIAGAARALSLAVPASVQAIAYPQFDELITGQPSAQTGEQAFQAVKLAASMVASGNARALVTAPLAKAAMHAAGHQQYPGHTELLADLAGGIDVRMMLANPELRTVLVTVHLPLREALDRLSIERIFSTLQIAHDSLRRFGINRPRLAVAGVNPHAGENGLFGAEEAAIVTPAIERARAAGIDASGPYAPDTVFMRARGLREFDAVIAMYHDQGLIPVKYLGVANGVNVTLGLPYVRTSPDHGTAFDIAGTGQADPASMLTALQMADELSRAPV